MINATVIGTLSNIPNIPQILPHSAKDIIATRGLIFKVLPISFGSTRLPIRVATPPTPKSIIKNGTNSPN